jgi:hypothetical protein
MKSNLFLFIFILILISNSSSVFAEEDICREEGIVVKNLTLDDLWYQKDQGPCIIWKRNKIFIIKPEDRIKIFSDMICQKTYCSAISFFHDYKSFDTDGNCRIKILPGCNITDM